MKGKNILIGIILCLSAFFIIERNTLFQMIEYITSKNYYLAVIEKSEVENRVKAFDLYFVTYSVEIEGKSYSFRKRVYLSLLEDLKFSTSLSLLSPGQYLKIVVINHNNTIDSYPVNYIKNYVFNIIVKLVFYLIVTINLLVLVQKKIWVNSTTKCNG